MAITTNYQLLYNGLTLGCDTNYEVIAVHGLDDLPELRTSDTNRPSDHGMFAGRDLAAGRTIEVEVEVWATDETAFRANVDALGSATIPRDAELALVFRLPGFTDDRQIMCRPRRRALPTDLAYSFQVGQAILQFFATDPRVYAATATVLSLSLPTATGGLVWPVTWPISWGTATSGTVSAVNGGSFPTKPVVRFDGPLTGPSIENVTASRTLRFASSFEIASGDYVDVDFAEKTVLLNGTASRYSELTSASQWWDLGVGTNELRLGGVAGTGSATVTFRSAWL